MSNCNFNVNLIQDTEKIGDSLTKINSNFQTLQNEACELEGLLNLKQVRTFFYYGPNAATMPTSNMNNNSASFPSNSIIQDFINSSTKLNLIPISESGDIAYVIYQKTGWFQPPPTTQVSNPITGTIPFSRQYNVEIPITRIIDISRRTPVVVGYNTETRTHVEYVGYSWTATVEDRYNFYQPIFVIYKLTFNGTAYVVDPGFPKFNYGITNSTINWNNPTTWSTY
jgi:hypothetical protein